MRFVQLDIFRGFACLMVLLFHYTTKYAEIFSTGMTTKFLDFKYGGLGVDLFFIISGFVIFLTLKKNTIPIEFVYKRFTRLFPTFWICVFTTFFIVRSSELVNYHRSFNELVINLTMVPDLFGVRRVDGVYWSLLPELFFYFLMYLILVLKKVDKIDLICCVWLLLVFFNTFSDVMPIRVLLNLKFGHLFIIGICFYKINFGESKWFHHLLIISCYIVSLKLNNTTEKHLISLIFILIFYLFVYGKLSWLKSRPLVVLGEISYALYLVHQFIGYTIIKELSNFGINNSILLLLTPTFLTILIAYIITYYFERPIQLYLRKIFTMINIKTSSNE